MPAWEVIGHLGEISEALRSASKINEARKIEEIASAGRELEQVATSAGEGSAAATKIETTFNTLLNFQEGAEIAADEGRGLEIIQRWDKLNEVVEGGGAGGEAALSAPQKRILQLISEGKSLEGMKAGDVASALEKAGINMSHLGLDVHNVGELERASGAADDATDLAQAGRDDHLPPEERPPPEEPPSSTPGNPAERPPGSPREIDLDPTQFAEIISDVTLKAREGAEAAGKEGEAAEVIDGAVKRFIKRYPKFTAVGTVLTVLWTGHYLIDIAAAWKREGAQSWYCQQCVCDKMCECCQPSTSTSSNPQECISRSNKLSPPTPAPSGDSATSAATVPDSSPETESGVDVCKKKTDMSDPLHMEDDLCPYKAADEEPNKPPPATLTGGTGCWWAQNYAGAAAALQPYDPLPAFIDWAKELEDDILPWIEGAGWVMLFVVGVFVFIFVCIVIYKIFNFFSWLSGLFSKEKSTGGDSSPKSGSEGDSKKKKWWKRARESTMGKYIFQFLGDSGPQQLSGMDGGGKNPDKLLITLLLFIGYLLFYLYERYSFMIKQKEKLKEYYQQN